jgi:hypothetical protein
MKNLLIITSILLFVIILLFATGWIEQLFPYLKPYITNLKDFSGAITAIVGMLNIYFLISFRSIDSEKKRKESELQKISFWYREIVLERNFDKLDLVDEFIKHLKTIVKNNRTDIELINLINKLQDTKRTIINSLNNSIRILNKNFASKLDLILDNFEDSQTELSEDLFTCSESDFEEKIDEIIIGCLSLKNDLIEKLYIFEVQGYKFKTNEEKKKREWKSFNWPWSDNQSKQSASL